ncbi:MAG TPA: NAD(P)H-binding protein [Proteiniphilum sp.]|nr:NAD(P)H-binding protein [Proteiniphilum sp.]HPD87487.1 NAD(P)H-binding protein [Proteiniphilum sp.]HPJ50781.1 NAD(P)H-binding protein [Proteiniphilum sp.]HPR20148.1 NAD(P)H-binding protein [Proteiniphilum sp.]
MKALLIGATGATGSDLLQLLLGDSKVERVAIFVRRDPQITHPKLEVHLIDFDKKEQWRHLVKGDILFSCLGTTLKDAGSKEAQWKVDHDYQYRFAEAARENGVGTLLLVSSMNASLKSPFFYARMKGELEEAVRKLGFPRLMIFRPPSLIRKGSDRAMERVGVKLIGFLNRLGLLKSMRPIPTERLAQAMLYAAKSFRRGEHILEPVDIDNLV